MRAPSLFALLVPTARPAAIRFDRDLQTRRANRLAMAALVAMLGIVAYATGGDAQGRPDAMVAVSVQTVVDAAPAANPVSETWAADESRNGTRPDAAH